MNVAIARWHSNARPSGNDLEQAYADRLETEMQEMAIQLHQARTLNMVEVKMGLQSSVPVCWNAAVDWRSSYDCFQVAIFHQGVLFSTLLFHYV